MKNVETDEPCEKLEKCKIMILQLHHANFAPCSHRYCKGGPLFKISFLILGWNANLCR